MPIATPEIYAEMLDKAKASRSPTRPSTSRPRRPSTPRSRASPRPAATASSRSRPAARSTSPARRSRTWSPARSRSRRSPHEVAKNYPVNVALHTDHCPKDKLDGFVRPLLDICVERVERGEDPLFQSHMWDGSAVPLDENLADRPGAAREVRRGADHPRDRDRRGRRRGGRRRGRDRRQALHHRRRRAGHGRGARARREGPLPDRADLRQRARRLQARQRQAPPGDPQEGAGGGRREARPRGRLEAVRPGLPRRLRLDWPRRSPPRSTTAS